MKTESKLEKKIDYKTYIIKKFEETSKEHSKESLEIAKNFLVLYSVYEGSFKLKDDESLTIKNAIKKIKEENFILEEIDEIYNHFYKRYSNKEELKKDLFNGRDQIYEEKFERYLKKDSLSNLEKQFFIAMIANRYRNNTLHATKKYFNWYKYRVEFDNINKFLYLWLKKKGI